MTRLAFVSNKVLEYYMLHAEFPGQIDMHPVFLRKLELEIESSRKFFDIFDHAIHPVPPIQLDNTPYAIKRKFYGIPIYLTEKTRAIDLHSRAAVEY